MIKCLNAAILAPNSSNLQTWEFYWVRNLEKKKKVIEACFSQNAAKTAKEIVIAIARIDTWQRNRDLIIENDMHNPSAVQVGGSEIDDLKKCAKIAKQYNYDEINLNVGCPSKAVQKGSFGACLMKNKTLVRNSLEEMKNASNIKVSIKCRIGIGKEFNYDFFSEFINEILKSEISIVYVHARNAILSGISPKANRNIPPLNYDFIKKIKLEYPKIQFIHLLKKRFLI